MAASPFKLSCVLSGHSLDVRTVAVTWDGKIVSGSRDKTAKIWTPETGRGYKETMTFCEHNNFVASVCTLIPTEIYPSGLIATGSNDHYIRLFIEATEYPLHILKEHTDTVCKLTPGLEEDCLLSSSWDKTAKLWDLKTLRVMVTFFGHDAAVWSILQLPNGVIVTASADKTIKIWSKDGFCYRTLIGHTDCVRDLAAISSVQVLSCSNDSSVRLWDCETGDCLNVYYGHSSFIYSISPFGSGFISSGEDKAVKVWANGEVSESIPIPACSVWCVAAAGNGDIVVGSSDGIIRVFSSDVSRQASAEELLYYEEQISVLGNGEVSDIKVSNLPGLEALIEPGIKDNQTKLINENNTAVAYAWSESERKWNKVGTVVGSAGNAGASSSGKQVFEGVEYDFVFSVDVEEGKPPLKLPYNRNQNPWEAARNFILQNNLSEDFLDEVANFIVKNSNQNQNPISGNEFSDPFTGSARYVPGGSEIAAADSRQNNRNFPSPTSYSVSSSDRKTMAYFPQREFIRFDQANLPVILEKLLEFNRRSGDRLVLDSDIEDLMKVCEAGTECTPENILTLSRLMEWPDDIIFPVLDVMRLAIRNPDVNSYLCTEELLPTLMRFLPPKRSTSPNNMLAMRVLSNMLISGAGLALAEQNKLELLDIIKDIPPPYVKNLQVAMATLLLNVAVLIHRSETTEGRREGLAVAKDILPHLTDGEALFRALVALGTLLDNFEDIPYYSGTFAPLLVNYQNNGSLGLRIQDCATQILLML